MFEHLKPGDEVAICHGKWKPEPTYELATVAKVQKQTLALADGRLFNLKHGTIQKRQSDTLSQNLVVVTDEIRAKAQATIGGR